MTHPYPLIDPQRFFEPLSPLGYRNPFAALREHPGLPPGMFGEFGYMPGTDGASIGTGHTWSQRASPEPNEYDFSVTVIHCPSEELASQVFETERIPARGFKVLEQETGVVYAAQSVLLSLGPARILNLRYRNYFIKAGAFLSPNGGIKTEADAQRYFGALDRQVNSVLGSIYPAVYGLLPQVERLISSGRWFVLLRLVAAALLDSSSAEGRHCIRISGLLVERANASGPTW